MALYDALAPYYDRVYATKSYETEARRLRGILRSEGVPDGARLLDAGCGTGRHLAQFRRWYRIAGVDASAAMLRVARRTLGPRVPLRRGEFERFRLRQRFDALTCLFSAYGYLTTPGARLRGARNFRAHLRPGGVALVEGWVLPERWRSDRPVHSVSYADADVAIARVGRSVRRGPRTWLVEEYLVARRDGPIRHYREVHRLVLVPAEEHLRTFRQAGFRARVLRSGPFRDRGLYILRVPEASGDARRVNRA